jgi:hypothetical protein
LFLSRQKSVLDQRVENAAVPRQSSLFLSPPDSAAEVCLMAVNPGIGESAGQQYDIVRAIQTFLGQMAEGGISVAAAVIKELLQNADDAGATEVSVILDERIPPASLPEDYRPLLSPAIVVRNNRPFRLKTEVTGNETDDFTAICDVARGHKRAQATAAGRFGIGFNSVYFLSDTPILFSRREVHVFDLLHRVFEANGWRFCLSEFPAASGSLAGRAKGVVQWFFPRAVLDSCSFESVANSATGDFSEAVVRLPLRDSLDGVPALHADRFRGEAERERVLEEMAEQAAKAILFLKHVRSITFGKLSRDNVELLHTVSATESPTDFNRFLLEVAAQSEAGTAGNSTCEFNRKVTWCNARKDETAEWNFWVCHRADFTDARLRELRARLKQNEERAIPWGAIAVPLDARSVQHDGEVPAWRVFLPLREEGPSACVFCGAFFIGPSRQHTEFRLVGSDEALRKTEWNRSLVERVLVPLLRDGSDKLPDRVPQLISEDPKRYLSLFPRAPDAKGAPATLADYYRQQFAKEPWILRLFDIWEDRMNPVELLVGDEEALVTIEMIPEWLLKYRDRFKDLSTSARRFVKRAVGDALRERVAKNSQAKIRREIAVDVARAVLSDSIPPEASDLENLLKWLTFPSAATPDALDGVWAFARAENGEVLRYSKGSLYVIDGGEPDAAIHDQLRNLPLVFDQTEWVKQDAGLPMIPAERRRELANVICGDTDGALRLLGRVRNARHNALPHSRLIIPIIDFLTTVPAGRLLADDLKLGFLVRTANHQQERRKFGVILLKPETPSGDEDAVWEVLLRRTLATVDAECAHDISRLLHHQPTLVSSLGDEECDLRTATVEHWLSILDAARTRCPDLIETLREKLNQAGGSGTQSRDIPTATAAVLREAVRSWERMSPSQQETVLALPIHRTSSGAYVSLIGKGIGDSATLQERCRIQSTDDIGDAPVTLSACLLLDSADPLAKQLYREHLRIDEHGRIAVLKEVLRQIGSAGDKNLPLLEYLGLYWNASFGRLAESRDVALRKDAADLEKLFRAAKSMPCINGEWRPVSGCRDGRPVVRGLEAQGWDRRSLRVLLPRLFPSLAIAAVDDHPWKLLQRVHPELEPLAPGDIANAAVTSESVDLDLCTRLKILLDNGKDVHGEPCRAPCISEFKVPTIAGSECTLGQAVLCIPRKSALSPDLMKRLVPEAVDCAVLASEIARQFRLQPDAVEGVRRELPDALSILGVARFDDPRIRQWIASNFSSVWPQLADGLRLELLECVATHALTDDVKPVAVTLPTVRVCGAKGSKGTWMPPTTVIRPSWTKTAPPCVSPETCAHISGVSDLICQVWDSWCTINGFDSVAALVVDAAGKSGPAGYNEAARELCQWLDRVQEAGLVDRATFFRTLRGLSWVLARRSAAQEFRPPSEVFIHPGRDILSHAFWVVGDGVPLPASCKDAECQQALGFRTEFPAAAAVVEQLAHCLERSAGADRTATMAVYRDVADLIEKSEELRSCWATVARERRVFRLFRDGQDRTVPALSLFIGDNGSDQDFGDLLYCLRAGKPQAGSPLVSLFRRLHVPECPEPRQLLAAMSRLQGAVQSQRATYDALIDALVTSWSDSTSSDAQGVRQIRIATCAGTFSALSECYWDDLFSDPSNVAPPCRPRVIDGTDGRTRRLVNHLLARAPDAVQSLATVATPLLSPEPQPVEESPPMRELLDPWRTWLAELTAPDSVLHEEAGRCGLVIPRAVMQVLPVQRIPLCFGLPQGDTIRISEEWIGPVAVALDDAPVFVRADCLTENLVTDVPRLECVDREIREQLAGVLVPREVASDGARERALTFIKETVERPAVVLERLRASIERNSFYQYYDQAADPEFAGLYHDYVRTTEGSPRHESLAAKLRAIVTAKFVTMRREQIRAYGYDEFSVFAELVQNAEDAYTQRQRLGLAAPPHWSVSFRFVKENDGTTLTVEHWGRPFNCWRHGNHRVEAFRKDVEGVLRSSGSFKPYGQEDASETQVIGRFGLGFKSVYLLTDCPAIFSGGWNFRIEDGLPLAVARPSDLNAEATRISLPLREPPRALPGAGGPHALCLLPFLRQTREISITLEDGRQGGATVSSIEELARGTVAGGAVAELFTVNVSESITSRCVRFIRIRSAKHFGQLAMLLASDGLPAPWSDGFTRTSGHGQSSVCDLYSALPLKSELRCGVAVSHRFDVQSGRTHLVDSRENVERAEQVADLLACLPDALQGAGVGNSVSERLLRFWSVWRWDRGDAETGLFRTRLAKQLSLLSRQKHIVPTLDEATAVSLSEQPLFSFSGVPQGVIDALLHAGFCIKGEGMPSCTLSRGNILAPGFVGAFRRLAQFTQSHLNDWMDVSWDVIATMCQKTPWLATHPAILDAVAAAASEEMRDEISVWLAQCRVRGVCGGREVHEVPRDMVLETGDVGTFLPVRLLALVNAQAYSQGSLELLRLAGLSDRPSSTSLRAIIGAKDLTTSEAENVLRFLAKEKRWRNYDDVQAEFRGAWFPTKQGRLTVAAADARSVIGSEAVGDSEFRAWLGIGAVPSPPPPPPQPPIDARRVLLALHAWWRQHGSAWEQEYERRTYPGARPPQLTPDPDLNDLPQRKEWLGLLLLGACHTIGRARAEQHRGFLETCRQNNWLDTFAARESSADDWMSLLESYLDRAPGEVRYYQWVKLFVPIFHLSRWLDTYVTQARSMNRRERFRLQQIFAPRLDARASGSGRDAPSGDRALGIGACFVARELCRLGVVSSEYAHEHCYVPSARIRRLLEAIAGRRLFVDVEPSLQGSVVIFRFLRDTFGEGGEDLARFRAPRSGTTERCGFDLPLLALCEDEGLRRKILGRDVSIPHDADTPSSGAADEGWRTLPDGRRIKLW